MMVARIVALLFLALAGVQSAVAADKRVALVIGNGDYAHTPRLRTARKDAELVNTWLRKLGFRVLSASDIDRDGMREVVLEFASWLENADLAVVYFAGHAIQKDGKNYLLPVDAEFGAAEPW